jgi:predicted GNAT family acetyltransferase
MSEVRNNETASRYEMEADGEIAFAGYREEGGNLVFHHTVVPEALEGRGIGSALVRGALADVRERGLKVVPACSFVAGWIERHPEAQDLVAGTKRD